MKEKFRLKKRRREAAVANATIESLEARQLLSVAVDLRGPGQSKSINVASVGQLVPLSVWVTVTGQDADPTEDKFQSLLINYVSTAMGFGAVAGNLSGITSVAPFNSPGRFLPGAVQDLNGDGNLDVGTNDASGHSNDVPSVGADALIGSTDPAAVAVGGSLEFKVATLSYTVTNLNFGNTTDIKVSPILNASGNTALWTEDNVFKTQADEPIVVGAPFVVTDTNIQPPKPIAVNDTFSTPLGQSDTVNVLANDGDVAGTIIPSTLTISTPPNHGGTATVDPNTFDVIYTPAPNFVGTETFQYTIGDGTSTSDPATVTFTVVPTPPTANDDSATTSLNTPVVIPVLANDVSLAGLNLTSVTFTNPSKGFVTANSDGTLTYTPNNGALGTDSFTYQVSDIVGSPSNSATVNVNIGVAVGSTSGARKILKYTDGDGTVATLTLNRGQANVFFNNTASVVSDHLGRITLAGVALSISDILLTSTTAASALVITGRNGDGMAAIGGISDAGSIGRIIAPVVDLTGTLNVNGLSSLQIKQADSAQIQIGAGIATGAIIIAGAMNNSALTSGVPIRLLNAASWTTTGSASLTAPSAGTLVVRGNFAPNLDLTGSAGLTVASIGGALSGTWAVNGGARVVVAHSDTGGSFSIAGALNVMLIRTGGLPASVSAGTIGTLLVTGPMSGNITAASARVVHVTGDLSSSTINLTGSGNNLPTLSTLSVGGAITGTNLTSNGNISSIVAGSLINSQIAAGSDPGVTVDTASSANLGDKTINSIRLTSRAAPAFANSTILAHKIVSESLGPIATNNNGVPNGTAAVALNSLSGNVNNTPFALSSFQLTDQAALDSSLAAKDIFLVDVVITIAP